MHPAVLEVDLHAIGTVHVIVGVFLRDGIQKLGDVYVVFKFDYIFTWNKPIALLLIIIGVYLVTTSRAKENG